MIWDCHCSWLLATSTCWRPSDRAPREWRPNRRLATLSRSSEQPHCCRALMRWPPSPRHRACAPLRWPRPGYPPSCLPFASRGGRFTVLLGLISASFPLIFTMGTGCRGEATDSRPVSRLPLLASCLCDPSNAKLERLPNLASSAISRRTRWCLVRGRDVESRTRPSTFDRASPTLRHTIYPSCRWSLTARRSRRCSSD